MNKIIMILLTTSSVVFAIASKAEKSGHSANVYGNIVCTEQLNNEIIILKPSKNWNRTDAVAWRWSPQNDSVIAAKHKAWFNNLSDAKCVINGNNILITASGGAVALIEIACKKTVFYAFAGGNPHSAEMLPDGNIVSVSSTGNFIKIFNRSSKFTTPKQIKSIHMPYPDAHGVVWDHEQQLLWILGLNCLTAFKYNFSKKDPKLVKVKEFHAPSNKFGGHDLFPIPHTRRLYLSGTSQVLEFDTVTHQFKTLLKIKNIKSISRHPDTGQIIIQTPAEHWWNDSITIVNGKKMTLTKARFYKARWFVNNEFSYNKN
ncbi:MAG: hypothetical protein JXR78_03465 [Victivallales bacterium]|nr:hypothetical protein [Victivallales bacterium]